MTDVPSDRCGYTYPRDSASDAIEFAPPGSEDEFEDRENTCIREPLSDAERCKWHAEPKESKHKTKEIIQTNAVTGSLDGAIISVKASEQMDFDGISIFSNCLLRRGDLSGIDLSGVDLSESDLSGTNLCGINMSGANLSKTNLSRTDLRGANLQSADLTEAYLNDANISNAWLRGAVLSEASLDRADLSQARLDHAFLINANLSFAVLANARLNQATLFKSYLYRADLSESEIPAANAAKADFERADLSDTNLSGIDLSGADLKHANLTNSILSDGDLSMSYMNSANLTESDLKRVNFTDADLSKTELFRADCEDAAFNESNLNRATFENANIVGCDFTQAYLYQTRFTGAQIDDTTQFNEAGEIGEIESQNACRYDSDNLPNQASEAIKKELSKNEDKNPEEIRARRARSTYNRLEDLARENGFPGLKSEMFVRKQEARKELLFAQGQLFKANFARLQDWMFRYGESFSRIIAISGGTIIASWLAYVLTGSMTDSTGAVINWESIVNDPTLAIKTISHSVHVFASGNQILTPTNLLGQVLIATESIIGPLLIALLIFVLGRRAAR